MNNVSVISLQMSFLNTNHINATTTFSLQDFKSMTARILERKFADLLKINSQIHHWTFCFRHVWHALLLFAVYSSCQCASLCCRWQCIVIFIVFIYHRTKDATSECITLYIKVGSAKWSYVTAVMTLKFSHNQMIKERLMQLKIIVDFNATGCS